MTIKSNPLFNEAYNEVIKRLELAGITPLIKIDDAKDALPLMGALTAAGINTVEITFRTSAAKEVLRLIGSKNNTMMVGAGTIISVEQVNDAVMAGAKYIVTPAFNPKVVDRCIELGIPVFPGCSNASDIEQAAERGLRVVKFFPAELLGGVAMLKALSGPYPFMRFIPTGGIRADNLNAYLKFNKVLCCGGTYMVDENLLKQKQFQEITRIARESVMKTFSKLSGEVYKEEEDKVCGIEVVRENHIGKIGHIAFSSPNLERCVYYLGQRGFTVDSSTIVKENGKIAKLHLAGDNAGFTIQLIRKV